MRTDFPDGNILPTKTNEPSLCVQLISDLGSDQQLKPGSPMIMEAQHKDNWVVVKGTHENLLSLNLGKLRLGQTVKLRLCSFQ